MFNYFGRLYAALHCIILYLCVLFALIAVDQVRGTERKPTIAQGNSPDCTPPQRMSAMTAHAQNQAAPEAFRDVAEKSAAQAKENFEKISTAAGEATNQLKNTYATTFKGAQDYSTKVLEFAHVNINAAFEHARKLSSVKSPGEFFALSNDHLRQQFEILSRQAQELAAIGQRMTAATTESIKAGVHKAV
jgi:phasin